MAEMRADLGALLIEGGNGGAARLDGHIPSLHYQALKKVDRQKRQTKQFYTDP